MNNVVRGVTSDTLIKDAQEQAPDIDIHEIVVDTERNDKYSQDIYEPDYNAHNEDTFELAYDDIDNNDYYPDNESHVEDIQPDYMSNDYMSDDEVTGAAPEDVTGYVESSYEDETPYDNDEIFENDVTNEEHKEKTEKEPEQVKPVHKPKKVYKFPPVSLLKRNPGTASGGKSEYRVTAQRLQETLLTFGVKVTITDISCGPTVTRYELQPEQGVKVSKIVSLSDDIKLNLAAADIRIEAPIPGKLLLVLKFLIRKQEVYISGNLLSLRNSRKASQQYHSELVRISQERLLLRILRRCRICLLPEQQVQVNRYVSTQ